MWRVQNSETRKWVTYPRVSVVDEDGANNKEGEEEEEENVNKELIDEEFVKMYAEVKIPRRRLNLIRSCEKRTWNRRRNGRFERSREKNSRRRRN